MKSPTKFHIIYLAGWLINGVLLGILLSDTSIKNPFVIAFGFTFIMGGLRFLLEGVTKYRCRFSNIQHFPLSWYFYATLAIGYCIVLLIELFLEVLG